MSNRLAVFAAICAAWTLADPVFAGQAHSSKSFYTSHSYSQAESWFEAHRQDVYRAANCQITRELGEGRYRVKSDTPLGAWHYVVQETVSVGRVGVVIRVSLADRLKTKIAAQEVTITIKPRDEGCHFTIAIHQHVKSRLAPSVLLRRSQKSSLGSVQRYLQESTVR